MSTPSSSLEIPDDQDMDSNPVVLDVDYENEVIHQFPLTSNEAAGEPNRLSTIAEVQQRLCLLTATDKRITNLSGNILKMSAGMMAPQNSSVALGMLSELENAIEDQENAMKGQLEFVRRAVQKELARIHGQQALKAPLESQFHQLQIEQAPTDNSVTATCHEMIDRSEERLFELTEKRGQLKKLLDSIKKKIMRRRARYERRMAELKSSQ